MKKAKTSYNSEWREYICGHYMADVDSACFHKLMDLVHHQKVQHISTITVQPIIVSQFHTDKKQKLSLTY